MARAFTPKIVTANHLLEGDAIYFTAQKQWSDLFDDAVVLETAEQADAALEEASSQVHIVAGAYLADVELNADGQFLPTHFREAFRTTGPSNYFHGKQAEV